MLQLSLYVSFIPNDLSSCSRNANYLGNLDTVFVSIIVQIRTELIGLSEEKAAFVDELSFTSCAGQSGYHLSPDTNLLWSGSDLLPRVVI